MPFALHQASSRYSHESGFWEKSLSRSYTYRFAQKHSATSRRIVIPYFWHSKKTTCVRISARIQNWVHVEVPRKKTNKDVIHHLTLVCSFSKHHALLLCKYDVSSALLAMFSADHKKKVENILLESLNLMIFLLFPLSEKAVWLKCPPIILHRWWLRPPPEKWWLNRLYSTPLVSHFALLNDQSTSLCWIPIFHHQVKETWRFFLLLVLIFKHLSRWNLLRQTKWTETVSEKTPNILKRLAVFFVKSWECS